MDYKNTDAYKEAVAEIEAIQKENQKLMLKEEIKFLEDAEIKVERHKIEIEFLCDAPLKYFNKEPLKAGPGYRFTTEGQMAYEQYKNKRTKS